MTNRMRTIRNVLAMGAVAALATACGGGDSGTPPDLASPAPLSIVVIGDSIASGEGIAYGYTYNSELGIWTGGVTDPQWQGEYQLCHDTPQAYGDVVATMVGATLAKFACTGSTYENGIVSARQYLGTTYRPAQFGNWSAGTQLNPAYDAAKPDVVIVTLGADDVSFADILQYCVLGSVSNDDRAALMGHPERSRLLRERVREQLLEAAALPAQPVSATAAIDSGYCTAKIPGEPIEQLFWSLINSGQLAGTTGRWSRPSRRAAKRPGIKVPKVILTTYHQPLPSRARVGSRLHRYLRAVARRKLAT